MANHRKRDDSNGQWRRGLKSPVADPALDEMPATQAAALLYRPDMAPPGRHLCATKRRVVVQ